MSKDRTDDVFQLGKKNKYYDLTGAFMNDLNVDVIKCIQFNSRMYFCTL